MGSPMNTFRSGSSITRMGRFLVAMGGRGRSARDANHYHFKENFMSDNIFSSICT